MGSFAPYNLTIFSDFWHTHHEYTADMWLLKGAARSLGLGSPPFEERGVNLTAVGMTIDSAASKLLANARSVSCSAQQACTPTRLICFMKQDRWSLVDGYLQERKRMPDCPAFDLMADDVVTMISFHKPLKPLSSVVRHAQHAAWYAYFQAKEPKATIPHMIYGFVVPQAVKPV